MSRKRNYRFDVVDGESSALWGAGEVDATGLCLALRELDLKTVSHLCLYFRAVEMPLSAAYDVSSAIKRVASHGVRVVAYAARLDLSTVLAMSPCGIRCCPPLAGPVSFGVRLRHYGISSLLRSLGIAVDLTITSPLKLAAVACTEEGTHEAGLAQERSVLDDVFRRAIEVIEENTGVRVDPSRMLATAAEAAEEGLLTHVGYADLLGAVDPSLEGIRWEEGPRRQGVTSLRSRFWRPRGRASLLVLEVDPGFFAFARPHLDAVADALVEAARLNWVRGVLLIVNHAGGDLAQADRLWCLVSHLRRFKPVVAYVRAATSAGYCIASASENVIANPCALIGGMGAVTLRVDASVLAGRLGIRVDDVIAGGAPVGDFQTPVTAAERQLARRRGQTGAELFCRRVMAGRGIDREELTRLADGRLFSLDEAMRSNLVDRIGTVTSAMDQLTSIVGRGNLRTVRLVTASAVSRLKWPIALSLAQWLTSRWAKPKT